MLKILLGSFTGTLSMILFGSMVPRLCDKIKFALLLNMLVGKGIALIHYLVGLVFIIFYDWIWRSTNWEPTILTGMVLGSANGIVGVLIAKIIVIRNDCPEPIALTYFYNIVIAHLIFGAGTVLGYQIANE